MIKNFPIYKQHDTQDCGAACLRMVARHFGRFYSLEYLREITNVNVDGVSLLDISDAAEHIGMHTLAAKLTFDRLAIDIPMPFIAHWRSDHFVVVYKLNSKNVWIADPAAGKVKLTKEEFLNGWISDNESGDDVGVVLLMEPNPEFFEREGEKADRGRLRYISKYLWKYKKLLAQLVIGVTFGSLLIVIFPFLLQAIVDDGIETQDFSFVVLILIAWLILFLGQISFEYIRGWILLHIGQRVNISLISDFLIKIVKLPLGFFDSKKTGDLLQRIYDNERIERFLTSTTLVSAFSAFTIIVLGLVLLIIDTNIFWLFFAFTVIYVAWVLFFLKRRKELDNKRFDQAGNNHIKLVELIEGMKDIKLHNAEKKRRWDWERTEAKLYRVGLKYLAVNENQQIGARIINESKNILIIIFAAKSVIDGMMTLGEMIAIQYIIGQINSPVNQLVNFIRAAQDAKISLERMSEIHNRDDEDDIDKKITIIPERSNIVVDNISFQYSGHNSPEILKSVSITIPYGKTTAIVGSSGSGKSTLIKLLLNFYLPTNGMIRVGEINLKNLQSKLWRKHAGAVLEDGFLFSDSIANNIALSDEVVDNNKLINAVQVANIQSFIESLPLGYNTVIGNEGMGLSQGQKQRILIAREVYKNPEFLFLDEATNSLDAYTELIVMENLEEFFKGKTMVIVAHRLITAQNADKIVVLENGEIIEEGSHDELKLKRGAYYSMVKNQLLM